MHLSAEEISWYFKGDPKSEDHNVSLKSWGLLERIHSLIVHADPTTVYNAPLVISNCKTILQGDLIKVDAEASISNVNPKICSRSLHLKTVSNPTERTALDGPLMIDTFYLRYHNHKSSKLVSTFLNLFEFLWLGNRTAESMGQKSHGGHGHWITKWIDHRFLLMGISIHNFVTGGILSTQEW